MPPNDVHLLLKRESETLAAEYEGIAGRVREDPGTAGDQGEENWAHIFRLWLPHYYHVRTKGRILASDGSASGQIDVLVLSPAYPKAMLDTKMYLAGGVVAAFECKTTLRSDHLGPFFEHTRVIKNLAPRSFGSPYRELQSPLILGFLAHSHEWKSGGSEPERNVTSAIQTHDWSNTTSPFFMPDFVCVADLGCWRSIKGVTSNAMVSAHSGYVAHLRNASEQNASFTPIGALLTVLYEKMAWRDPLMKDVAKYFRAADTAGRGEVAHRPWSVSFLSQEFTSAWMQRQRFPQVRTDFDEWSNSF